MKKLYFLFIALLITCNAFSQVYKPMLKENKTWDVNYSYPALEPYCDRDFSRGFLGKDTIVSGVNYFKYNNYNVLNPCIPNFAGGTQQGPFDTTFHFSNLLLREDSVSKKVWMRNIYDTTDVLLYDFSVNVGDTIYSFDDCPSDRGADGSCWGAAQRANVVDSIVPLVLLNGELTRAFCVSSLGFGSFKMIEGVGGLTGFIIPLQSSLTPQTLICVKDENGDVWNNGAGWCGTFVGIDEKAVDKVTLEIYPNPNNGESITINGEGLTWIELYNIQGQRIKTVEVKNDKVVIDLNAQPKGIYFVKAQFKNGAVTTKKLIIN